MLAIILKSLAVVASVALVGGALVTTSAYAQTASKKKDMCESASPAKVLTLSSGKTSVKAIDTRRSTSGLCKRFVVDVNVEHRPSDHQLVVDGAPMGLKSSSMTKKRCVMLTAHVTYYVKTARGKTFSRIGGGKMVGQWSVGGTNPGCTMKGTSSYKALGQRAYPAPGKTDTYRIAVTATLYRNPYRVPVVASARDVAIPK